MSVRMRHTRAHTKNRRSHHALKEPRLSVCSKCKAQHIRHRACLACGTYRSRAVVDVAKKALKKENKAKAREKSE
ncbi:50S ribosomal protein L32 [bacterium]|nr:50S ribosomal protein L32 [bacterium]